MFTFLYTQKKFYQTEHTYIMVFFSFFYIKKKLFIFNIKFLVVNTITDGEIEDHIREAYEVRKEEDKAKTEDHKIEIDETLFKLFSESPIFTSNLSITTYLTLFSFLK